MKTRRLSWAEIVTLSFSMLPAILSASSSQPSFATALTFSNLSAFVSTRFFKALDLVDRKPVVTDEEVAHGDVQVALALASAVMAHGGKSQQ
jgi:hypothetical protein